MRKISKMDLYHRSSSKRRMATIVRASPVEPEQQDVNQVASLFKFAREGDIDGFESLDRNWVLTNINEVDDKMLTPLHYAARYSHLSIVKQLVKHGANIHQRCLEEMTPLHYAARYGTKISSDNTDAATNPDQDWHCRAVVELLIKEGADVSARDISKQTALHHAAIRGNESVIHVLCSAATPNITDGLDTNGCTALHLAATYSNLEVAKRLLREGANPRLKDCDRKTPFHEACSAGNFDIAKELIDFSRSLFGEDYVRKMISDEDGEGFNPLLLSVRSNSAEIVELLCSFGVEATDAVIFYPLHEAARMGNLDILQNLVRNYRSHLNKRDSQKQTPLALASARNKANVLSCLVRGGANPNLAVTGGVTPVMLGAMAGHIEVVRELHNLGARLEILDKNDRSALHHAAESGHPTVLEYILNSIRGKQLIKFKDQFDNLPLHAASANGNVECVRLLLEKGSETNLKNDAEHTPLHLAVLNGQAEVTDLILSYDQTSVADEDENSNTALHLACLNERPQCVEVLLRYDADVQSRNDRRWTPLDCAANVGAARCAKLLIEGSALGRDGELINMTSRDKTTPLLMAAGNGRYETVELLLEKGADLTLEDNFGRNILELAILKRKRQIVKQVLEHKDWKKLMRSTYTERDKLGQAIPVTPLRMLVKIYPDLAELVLDKCITMVDDSNVQDRASTKDKIAFKFDHEFIDDTYYIEQSKELMKDGKVAFDYCPANPDGTLVPFKEPYCKHGKVRMDNHPLKIISKCAKMDLLKHPVCRSLVREKWSNYGQHFYMLNVGFYAIFLFFLTAYIELAPNPAQFKNTPNNSDCFPQKRYGKADLVDDQKTFQLVCQIGVLISVGLNALKGLVQFWLLGLRYLQPANVYDWMVFGMAFAFAWDMNNFSAGITETRQILCWQWEIGAVTIVLAWLNLLVYIRQLPFFGIYAIMFFDILKTFLSFAAIFFIFILAFSLGFHALILTDGEVADFGTSLIKTTVMMIGEYEFNDLFFSEEASLPYPNVTIWLFAVFVIIMSLIIMNLMVGLAVDDIKAVQDQASLKRLAMLVDIVLDTEGAMPKSYMEKNAKQSIVIKERKGSWLTDLYVDNLSFFSIFTDADLLKNKANPDEDLNRSVENSLLQLENQQKVIKKSVADSEASMRSELARIQTSIRELGNELRSLVTENSRTDELVGDLETIEEETIEVSSSEEDGTNSEDAV